MKRIKFKRSILKKIIIHNYLLISKYKRRIALLNDQKNN